MVSVEPSHHVLREGDIKEEDDGGHWYFSKKEIEENSPSRQDGIDLKKETYMRKSYCAHLQDLGMRLKVPQVTIATAIMFCHRFFIYQSHAKNDRKTIATVCMFLAGKVEETPRPLKNVILTSYEIIHKKDASAVQKIKQKDVYEKQKELILVGEKLVLATLAFDLNVLHPYKPLVEAIKKFKVAQNALAQVAWNFVNDGLRTSLCLQFKPHHIAAGAIFLAAKFLKVKLPLEGEMIWWQEFDVTPRQLELVSNQMLELYEQNRVPPPSQTTKPPSKGSSGNKENLSNENCFNGGAPSKILSSEVTQSRIADCETSETNCNQVNGTEHSEEQARNLSHKEDTKKIDKEKLKAAYERRKACGDVISQKTDPLDELERELEDVQLPEKIKCETEQSNFKHVNETPEEGEVEPFDDGDERGYISPRSSICKRKAEQQNHHEREHKKLMQENRV